MINALAMAAPTFLRRSLVVLAAMAAAVVGLGGTAGAQAGEVIHRYQVDIQIEPEGSMLVVERIAYDFGSNERHGIFRDLRVRFTYDERYDRVYPVDVLSVEGSPGTPDQYEVSEEGPLLRIRIGDPDETIRGRHRYLITYRVEGPLNGFADHDELYWNVIGHEWPVPIEVVRVRVAAPADVTDALCFAGPVGSTLPCRSQRVSGDLATFGHSSLTSFEGMTVVVAIPRGAVLAPEPVLDERWSLRRAFEATPVTVGAAGALLLLLVGGALRMAWVIGRDRRIAGSPVDVAFGSKGVRGLPQQAVPLFEEGATPVEYAPPDGIRPGQVGTLVDEVAGPLDVTATIVDLAVRGYLRIEEIPKRWIFGKVDWRLVKLKEADDRLLTYERMLLDNLFEDSDELEDEDDEVASQRDPGLARVRLSSLKKKFSERLHEVQEALYSDAAKRKWFAGRPDKVRQTWSGRGWVLLLAGGGLTGLAAAKSHLGLIPIPVILAGLVLIWSASRMPRRTAKGTGLVRRVLGFRTYIETAEVEESRFAERANLFSQYLPYAIVFGVTEKWAGAFADLDGQEDPTGGWYVGSRPFSAGGFSSSMGSFAVSTSGTISSTPAASGSSGFGGGGSSGGGGGGGGGGSW